MGGLLSIALGLSLASIPDGVDIVVSVDAGTPAVARARAEGVAGYLEDRLATWKRPLVRTPHRFRVVVLGRGDKRVELRLMGETALIAAREVAPSDALLLRATAWSFVRSAIRRTLIDRGALPRDAPDEGPELTPAIPPSTRVESVARPALVAARTPSALASDAAARAGAGAAGGPASTPAAASAPAAAAPAAAAVPIAVAPASGAVDAAPAAAAPSAAAATPGAVASRSAAAGSVGAPPAAPTPAASAPDPEPLRSGLEVEVPTGDAARALALLERRDAEPSEPSLALRSAPPPADPAAPASSGVGGSGSDRLSRRPLDRGSALPVSLSVAVLGAGDYAGDLAFGPRLRLRLEPIANLSLAIEGGWSRTIGSSELRLDSVPLAAAVGVVFGQEIQLGLAAQAQVVLHFASSASSAQLSAGVDLGLVAALSVPLTPRLSWAIRAFGGAALRRQSYVLDSGAKDPGILAASVATGLEWRWR